MLAERQPRLAGDLRRVGGLFQERDDAVVLVDVHDAEGGGLRLRDLDARDRHVGAFAHVLVQHLLVVHLVDVVAGQDDQVFRRIALDDVEVLVDRVGGAGVPAVLGDALARRQDVEAFVALLAQEIPAAVEMADQAVGLVLRRHSHAADARVQRVREREVDDARLAAEIDGGLRPVIGELRAGGFPGRPPAHTPSPTGPAAHAVASPSSILPGAGSSPGTTIQLPPQSSAGVSQSVDSGGRVRSALAGQPKASSSRASTTPMFPHPAPPYCVASVLRSSVHRPAHGRPTR